MAVRIPAQRTESPEPSEVTTDTRVCAVEDCGATGSQRFFPTYVLTLCTTHFVRAADRHRAVGRYW